MDNGLRVIMKYEIWDDERPTISIWLIGKHDISSKTTFLSFGENEEKTNMLNRVGSEMILNCN